MAQARQTQTAPQQSQAGADAKMQKYLDKAVDVLEKFGLKGHEAPAELIRLLEEVRHVDEARAVAIANTIRYMSTFNQLVRDNVENINVGNRYLDISQMF
ncbi:MAG TPA: cell surface protein, partial [Lacipirellulaceae bacterium]|nr:cell surface protein [Lacipirellulaceae bacterium]